MNLKRGRFPQRAVKAASVVVVVVVVVVRVVVLLERSGQPWKAEKGRSLSVEWLPWKHLH